LARQPPGGNGHIREGFNGLDWPAISLPCQPEGELPIGLQLAAPPGCDAQLLAQAAALEQLLSTPPPPIRETG
ncbi:MAG: hypothetical protein OXG37_13905, partial [Actinomycetia bacterium]|nr:hypothetical protein [Actinomycetes bacterium]